MNRNGQSTIIFIILVPVFLFVAAIVIDMGINMYNEKKLKNVTEDVVESLLENDLLVSYNYTNEDEIIGKLEEKAELIYNNNEIDTEYVRVEIISNDRIQVSNSHVYYSFMNSLFNRGNGNRQTIVDAEGYKDSNGVIIVEFKGDADEN